MKPEQNTILLAARYFYPTYAGGAERFRRYAPGLRSRGFDLRVFTGTPIGFDYKKNTPDIGSLLPLEDLEGFQIQRVRLPDKPTSYREWLFVTRLLDYCRNPDHRPSLIQTLSIPLWWLPHWVSLRRLGVPIVRASNMVIDLSANALKRIVQRTYLKPTYQIADCVVAQSKATHDALQDIRITRRIEVIPNGVDTWRFKPVSPSMKRTIREQLGLDPMAEMILFVGALIERKGVDVLIDAWYLISQSRPNAYLVLVGPRDTGAPFEKALRVAIADSGAPHRVLLTGRIENVESYYQSADIFVFPSRREGMANVVLEAFACGLPTVLTPHVGLSDEYGSPGQHYMLAERKPEALAQATIELLENSQRREELGQQARRWVEAHLSVDIALDRYARLYSELLD